MVADAITRYRLEDDSDNPELVQAIKESAGTLYGGDCCFLTRTPSKLTISSASVETVCFIIL
jgi:hypothetical protein